MPPFGKRKTLASNRSRDFDVVVVGGGGSGLAAAISAAESGATVAVLEKAPYLRGSTGRSIGSIAVSRTPEQRALGVDDSPEEHAEDYLKIAGKYADREDRELVRLLTENVTETYSWLRGLGMEFFGPVPDPGHRYPRLHNILPTSQSYIHHLAKIGATAEHGLDGRQPAPAHALPVPARRRLAVQQARPGSGCAALDGLNRGHAVLGTSEHCIATHPSDVAVALVAFDAVVQTLGPRGERALPIDDFFLLPGDTPEVEHPIGPGELILGIDVPGAPIARRSTYLKFRDRQSYEFALVSVAAALAVEDGVVADVRLALGAVGTKPWRARRAEAELVGGPASEAAFRRAAAAELEAADVREHNAFKVELAQRAIVRGLSHCSNGRSS